MSEQVYEMITNQIIEQLKKGVAPWHKPWRSISDGPRSIHGHYYRGINVFLLLSQGYDSPFWITFKEVQRRGGKVKKGEHGTIVIFWKFLKVQDKENPAEVKTISMLRYYRVWNLEQTTGIDAPKTTEHAEPTASARHNEAKRIVSGMPAAPKIAYRGDAAWYRPSADLVTVPPKKAYDDLDEFYATLFHELGHSTGHPERLNRPQANTFGSHEYGREELVAEMTAAYLTAEAGITATHDNSAAYLQAWIDTISEDVKAVVVAAGQAQHAADYILARETEEMAA